MPKFIDKDKLYELAKQVVDLAYEGLSERGLSEEKLLAPLYSRIEKQTNPAKNMLELLHSNTDLSDIILEYGKL